MVMYQDIRVAESQPGFDPSLKNLASLITLMELWYNERVACWWSHLYCLFHITVGWSYRIRRLYLCRGVRPHRNECSVYDIKQSDGEVPVMLELWGMRSTSSLPSLPGPHWTRVVALDFILSMGQIEINCELMLKLITWNRTVLTFTWMDKIYSDTKLNCLN